MILSQYSIPSSEGSPEFHLIRRSRHQHIEITSILRLGMEEVFLRCRLDRLFAWVQGDQYAIEYRTRQRQPFLPRPGITTLYAPKSLHHSDDAVASLYQRQLL